MTDSPAAPRRDDARALQARLAREIGVAAVTAALLRDVEPEPAADAKPRPTGAPDNRGGAERSRAA